MARAHYSTWAGAPATDFRLDYHPARSGMPPLAPGCAKARFAATGKRLRRLPTRAEDLKSA
jgi:hypothetical protein